MDESSGTVPTVKPALTIVATGLTSISDDARCPACGRGKIRIVVYCDPDDQLQQVHELCAVGAVKAEGPHLHVSCECGYHRLAACCPQFKPQHVEKSWTTVPGPGAVEPQVG